MTKVAEVVAREGWFWRNSLYKSMLIYSWWDYYMGMSSKGGGHLKQEG